MGNEDRVLCGRYVIYTADELIDLHDIVEEAQRRADAVQGEAQRRADAAQASHGKPLLVQTGEIFPTNIAPVLIPSIDAGTELTPHPLESHPVGRHPLESQPLESQPLESQPLESHPMIWGYPQFGDRKGVVFNTRLETANEKQYWRDSLVKRRCVVPMSGFFEWQHGGPSDRQRYLFDLPDEPVLYLAGIYKAFSVPDAVLANRFSIMTTAPNDSMSGVHNRMPVVLLSNEIAQWLYGDPFGFIDRSEINLRQQVPVSA